MQNSNSFFKDMINVMSSNFIILLSSLFTGFIIPLILGANDYGYYKTFILYTSYTSLLHFGFVDGILLKDSGMNYNRLDRYKFRSNTKFFIIFQLIISIFLSSVSFFVVGYVYKILFISLGIYTFLFNLITYYQFISQATMRFSELSIRRTLQSILTIIFILLLWLLNKLTILKSSNFSIFIFLILFINLILLLWYIYTYRDITFGKHDSIFHNLNRMLDYIITGFYLTISYQVSTLILNLDSQFVSFFFNSKTFGVYSFAYSLISVILTVLNAISTVLLPHMKKQTVDYVLRIYPKIISYIVILVYFCLLVYFPLSIIVKLLLPNYAGSLVYFRLLLPGVGVNCCITLVIFNYYNFFDKSKLYFYINLSVLTISAVLYFFAYFIFKSSVALSLSSLISLLIWYMVSEGILIKWYKVKWIKNFVYMILMMIIFLIISNINNIIISFALYLIIYLFVTFIMYFDLIKNIFYKLRQKM